MSFFGNGAINRVNLHSGVQAVAQGAGGVFVLVFLLKTGLPTPLVLAVMAGMTLGRFVLRPAVLPLARRLGLRATLILGTVWEAAIFPLLPLTHGPGLILGLIVAVSAVGSVLYWTCYHAYFSVLGDLEHRGSQIGAREAVLAVVNVAAPALGGWALVAVGPVAAFLGVALIQLSAALPLLGAPRVAVAPEAAGGGRAMRFGVLVFAAEGWFTGGFIHVWQVALFLALGQGFGAYGGAMALAGLLGAVGSLGLGRMIDLGHGRRSVALAYAAGGVVVALKALGTATPWLAVAANGLGALAAALMVPALMARIYNLSKQSACPLRFHMAAEGGWDLGCSGACLTAAGLVRAGLPLSAPILLSLAGVAGSSLALIASYPARPRPA